MVLIVLSGRVHGQNGSTVPDDAGLAPTKKPTERTLDVSKHTDAEINAQMIGSSVIV